MTYLTMPFVPALNLLGVLASDANLKFYLTETTTPSNVYADPDLSTSLGSVVNADAFGRFVAIYLDPDVIYRVRLETALGVLIQEADGITGGGSAADISFLQSGAGAVATTVQSKLRETISIKDFGAVCDGVTNDRAAVVLAMAAAGNRALVFPGITHIATALTITSPISDTSEQIFSTTSAVTISNGRPVRPEWWGAKNDGVVNSQPAIQLALTAAKDAVVQLSSGIYRANAKITIKGNSTDGKQKLHGEGPYATYLYCYGAEPGIQSDQAAVADYIECSNFTIENKGTLSTQTGLDIGTVRNSTFTDIVSKGYLIGFGLTKNVDAIGNYYNTLTRCVADSAALAPAGSIAYKFGNQIGGHTNRNSNANDMVMCRSYGYETGLDIYGTGNTIIGQKIVSCDNGVVMTEDSFDNRIWAYVEGVAGQNMGSAASTCVGNDFYLFNDATAMDRFVDSGWNNIYGNVVAGGAGYLSPTRTGDFKIADHISLRETGASIDVFSITLPVETFAGRVTVTLAGRTQFTSNDAGVQQWDIFRVNSATPTVSTVITNGTDKWTVTPAASGVITFAISGHASNASIYEITVDIQCAGYDVGEGGGVKCDYQRLV